MKEEFKKIINEYLETLKEEKAKYDVDGNFDRYETLEHIPTFTDFIKWLLSPTQSE
jgi:hypothetical protein